MPQSEERRRFIRLTTPINISYVAPEQNKVLQAVSKDISALGVRFETKEKIKEGATLELTLELPKLVWSKRISLEDSSPYDVGVEFIKIEEDNKNTFLKYLCDLIYNRPHK